MRHTLEEGEDGQDARGVDVDGQLVLPHRELLDVLGQAAHQPGAVSVQVVGLGLVFVSGVDDGRLESAQFLSLRGPHILDILREADGVAISSGGCGEASRGSFVPGRLDGGLRGSESLSQCSAPAEFAGHCECFEVAGRPIGWRATFLAVLELHPRVFGS